MSGPNGSPPQSPLDAAIEAAITKPRPAANAQLQVQLSGGRVALIQFPVPLSPDDALRIETAFGSFFLQNFAAEQKATAGGRIILPS